MATFHPVYLKLLESGELEKRVHEAKSRLEACDVCPLHCGVNRTAGELGVCKIGENRGRSSLLAVIYTVFTARTLTSASFLLE